MLVHKCIYGVAPHALWLGESNVCIRVCKHRCGVKMFRFSRGYHAGTNFKKFWSSKIDKFTLFTHFFVGWNWKIVTKKVCQFFFALADILSEKNSYFEKHLFAKQELITRARRRGQDFATGKNFSFNQCHTKSSTFFFRGSYFIKAIETFFPAFA